MLKDALHTPEATTGQYCYFPCCLWFWRLIQCGRWDPAHVAVGGQDAACRENKRSQSGN
jgi:hypothetical protein